MNNANAIRTPQAIPCPEATDLDPDYHPCAKTNRRAVLLITILGSSLAFMDGSIVNVALPTLQRAFHAGASSVQWVVQSYALFSAALLLFSGALGDQFGRKKIFVLGVAFFTASSLGCAVANSLPFLIVWRSLQGVEPRFSFRNRSRSYRRPILPRIVPQPSALGRRGPASSQPWGQWPEGG